MSKLTRCLEKHPYGPAVIGAGTVTGIVGTDIATGRHLESAIGRRLNKNKKMKKSAAYEAGIKEAFLASLFKKTVKKPLKMKFKGHESELKKAIKPGTKTDARGITTTRGAVQPSMGGIRKTQDRFVTL